MSSQPVATSTIELVPGLFIRKTRDGHFKYLSGSVGPNYSFWPGNPNTLFKLRMLFLLGLQDKTIIRPGPNPKGFDGMFDVITLCDEPDCLNPEHLGVTIKPVGGVVPLKVKPKLRFRKPGSLRIVERYWETAARTQARDSYQGSDDSGSPF